MSSGLRRLVHARVDAPGSGDPRERGFVLLEEIVSISLLMIVMAALATFFLTVTQSTSYERARQSAIQLANTEMNLVRGLPAADLSLGRNQNLVTAQQAAESAAAAAALTTTTLAVDGTATANTALTLPMTATAVANNINYTITNYLGTCSIPTSAAAGTSCTNTAAAVSAGTAYVRAVVAVTWPGVRCAASVCSYVTSTLISPAADSQWVYDQAAPAGPVVANPGSQVTTIGATVSLQLALQPNTGVPPATWSITGLPAGLSQSTTTPGLIVGTATALTSGVTVTAVATDAFVRSSPTTNPPNDGKFTWAVVAAPTASPTTPFTVTAGATVAQPLPYTCPTSTCAFALAGAPSGIGLSTTGAAPFASTVNTTGATSGNLTLGGTVPASLAPSSTAYSSDVLNQGATNYWRLAETTGTTGTDLVGGTPLTEVGGVTPTALGAILSSSTGAATFDGSTGYASTQTPVNASGTSTESVWFKTTSTAGGPLLALGSTTGTAGASDRILYLNSAGQLTFGLSTGGSFPTVTTSAAYNDGLWHQAVGTVSGAGASLYVDGALVGTNPGVVGSAFTNAYWHVGAVRMTGWPSAPSTFFGGTIDDAAVSSTTALTLAQVQQQYADSGRVPFAVTVTPTAAATSVSTAVAGPAGAAAWTVVPPPAVAGLVTPFSTTAGAAITAQPLPYNCPTASCTFSLAGAPTGIGLSTTAGGTGAATVSVTATTGNIYLVGTVASSASGTYTLVITPKDAASTITGATATAAWTVAGASVSGLTTPFTTTVTATIASQSLSYSCPSGSCSYTLAGAPTGIGLSLTPNGSARTSVSVGSVSGTIYLVGTVGGSPNTFTLVVTPRDTASGVAGTPAQAAWTVYAKPTVTGLTNPFSTTAGATIANQTLPYTCPSSSCTFTVAGAPTGIGLATTPTGTAAGSVTITGSTSGSLYLTGTVATGAAPTSTTYANDVASQGAINYWRLGETSGTVGLDSLGNLPLLEQSGVGHNAGGAIPGSADTASTFDGTTAGSAGTQTAITGPQVFSESIWFRTTTTAGGKLLGFGSSASGNSGSDDRHIYMDNAGHVTVGVNNGSSSVVTTSGTYNDGLWHQAVGTLSSAGLSLYLDGARIGTSTGVTSAQAFNGYWRLGGDFYYGWPSTGSSSYFAGTLDEASIYPRALTLAQVQQQWADAHASTYSLTVTPTDTASTVSGTVNSAAWTVNPPPAVSGLTSPFSVRPGTTIATQVLPYSCPTGSCTFTATGLPANIGISTTSTGGTLGATATVSSTGGVLYLRGTVGAGVAPGTYTVAVTPTDTPSAAVGVAAQSSWTVASNPTITGLPSSVSTYLGQQIATNFFTVSYTCPSLQCTFTISGLSGIGLGATSGATPSSSVSVTAASGNLYVSGTVAAVAGSYTLAVAGTDTASGSAATPNTSAVTNAGPTVTGQTTPLTTSVGATIANDAVAYTCPSSACTFRVSNAPSGIGLYTSTTGPTSGSPAVTVSNGSGTLYLRGTILASTPTGSSTVGITYTENTTSVSGPASSAAWTLVAAMALTPPQATTTVRGATTVQPFTFTCQINPCTISVTGQPAGIGISGSPSTGTPVNAGTVSNGSGNLYLRGTVSGSAPSGAYPIVLTLTDPAGSSVSVSVTWTVM